MGVNNIEVSNNSFDRASDLSQRQNDTQISPSSENTDRFDSFTPRRNQDESNFTLSRVSLFSLSGAVDFLKGLRDEKDSAIRNASVRKLINKLANEIKELYLSGRIFSLSKRELARLIKELKEICTEIDAMIREGLVELDFCTTLNYSLIKGFIECFDKKEEKIQFIHPTASSLSGCMMLLNKFVSDLQSGDLEKEEKVQIIAVIVDLVKQAIEFLKFESKDTQKMIGQQLLKIVQICKSAQTEGGANLQELESLEILLKNISKHGITNDSLLITVNPELSESSELIKNLSNLKLDNSPANQCR